MRLEILNSGYGLGAKALFAMIRVFTGQPMPDAARIVFYRPEFYGTPAKAATHEAMRGPSEWSVGDRELMAAYVSKANECEFCIGAHTATASGAYHDEAKVQAVLDDLDTAPIDDGLKATLRMLGTLTRTQAVDADDMRTVLAAGVSPARIRDALAVAFSFNTTNRLADALGFRIPGRKGFESGAKFLLRRGYR